MVRGRTDQQKLLYPRIEGKRRNLGESTNDAQKEFAGKATKGPGEAVRVYKG